MWTSVNFMKIALKRSNCSRIFRRTFLSESYGCREAWEKRLESPILKQVNTRSLFRELDTQFSHYGRASAIDVDIFVNACSRDFYVEDIETLLTLLRLCPDSGFTLPSTHHAVIRLLLDANKTEILLKVISNRLKYGIFPDHFCCNLLMDTFLKRKQYAAAARVGVTQMLQEDWENILTSRLSVYSCHMYLRNLDQAWYSQEEIVNPPPIPKEVVKVRVKYIRNWYYDDHFDLDNPKQLVGKTLAMFSSKIGGSKMLRNSYLLLGLTLHNKWDQVTKLAHTLTESKAPLFRESLKLARDSLETLTQAAQEEESSSSSSPKNPSSEPNQVQNEKDKKNDKENILEIINMLQTLETYASDEDFALEMETLVAEAVQQQEAKDIEAQGKLYMQWMDDRVVALQKQQEEIKKEEILKRVQEQKAQLLQEEREVFFFENENNLDLLIEEREKELASLDWIKENKKSTKQLREEADAAYIPPEVQKRHSSS